MAAVRCALAVIRATNQRFWREIDRLSSALKMLASLSVGGDVMEVRGRGDR